MSSYYALSPRRILSYSSQTSATGTVSSRSSLPPASDAPTSAIPEDGQSSRPSDVVINRLHEVKRITKYLAIYFEGLAAAHQAHSATLLKLSADPKILQTPLAESSLFIPAPIKGQPQSPTAQLGWSDLLVQIKEENKGVADEHKALADTVIKNVVTPLKKLRVDLKAHITAMEKEITKVADVVLKEREASVIALSHLSRALHPPPTPSGLSAPAQSASDDPYLHSVAADQQVKNQTIKENELLLLVQGWQEKSEKLEKDVWGTVAECWTAWEGANSTMLLGNQQRSVMLSANVDSVPPDAEWSYFARLNYLLPSSLQPQALETVTHVHQGDPLTIPLHHGLLERQKRFVKTWKPAYFVLTASGNLHEYKAADAPLDKPLASLALTECKLGPMPTPEKSVKGRPLEAMFTIEGADGSRNVFRAKSWEELGSWWSAIEKFTKTLALPLAPEQDADEGDLAATARSEEEEVAPLPSPPPNLPRRPVPLTPVSSVGPQPESDISSGGGGGGGDVGVPSSPLPSPSAGHSAPILTEAPDSPSRSEAPTSPREGDGNDAPPAFTV